MNDGGQWPTVGVAGARGVVGSVFLSILADAGLPPACLRLFGHEHGGSVAYRGTAVPVRILDDVSAGELDVLFLGERLRESNQMNDWT